ncbi:MAG: hypothetical protein KIG91_00640, partial [Treponema sp.]|nr:hypothetical protein [Treponema sp.]
TLMRTPTGQSSCPGISRLLLGKIWASGDFLTVTNFRQEVYSIPVTDVLIAYLGIKYDIPVWTKDHNFKLIQAVYPELKLYEM